MLIDPCIDMKNFDFEFCKIAMRTVTVEGEFDLMQDFIRDIPGDAMVSFEAMLEILNNFGTLCKKLKFI